jgi:hypothetical protein
MGPEANWTKRACLLSCYFDIDRVTFQYQMKGCFNLLGTETTKRMRGSFQLCCGLVLLESKPVPSECMVVGKETYEQHSASSFLLA